MINSQYSSYAEIRSQTEAQMSQRSSGIPSIKVNTTPISMPVPEYAEEHSNMRGPDEMIDEVSDV